MSESKIFLVQHTAHLVTAVVYRLLLSGTCGKENDYLVDYRELLNLRSSIGGEYCCERQIDGPG